jgi:hypothetical protein
MFKNYVHKPFKIIAFQWKGIESDPEMDIVKIEPEGSYEDDDMECDLCGLPLYVHGYIKKGKHKVCPNDYVVKELEPNESPYYALTEEEFNKKYVIVG